MPLCFSVGVKSAKRARNAAGKCSQNDGGVHLLLGHGELARAHVLHRVELDLLEADDLPVDPHVAVRRAARRLSGRRSRTPRSTLTCV